MQNLRFLLQRHLKVTTLSTMGATWARFAFAFPFVAVALAVYGGLSGQGLPAIPVVFWGYISVGALAQMLATAFVVALFARRNFAVGITLKKSEVILTALIGLVLLGGGCLRRGPSRRSPWASWAWFFCRTRRRRTACWRGRTGCSTWPRATGWRRGLLFGVSSVCYRGATLSLPEGDALLRAGVALLAATVVQMVTLGIWLALREPGQIGRVIAAWRNRGAHGFDLDAGLDGLVHGLRAADGGLCEGAGAGRAGLHLPLFRCSGCESGRAPRNWRASR